METVEKIAANVCLIYGEGFCSNIYALFHGRNALLIDSGSGSSIPKLDEALDGRKVERVILTHGHADHTHGMNYISADGFLHNADLKIIQKLNDFLPNYRPPNNIDPLDFDSLKFGDFSLKIIHTPGHSPGGISIFEEKTKLLFSGDTQFAGGGVGRTDLYGGNEAELMKSLQILSKIKYSKLCPGHGPLE